MQGNMYYCHFSPLKNHFLVSFPMFVFTHLTLQGRLLEHAQTKLSLGLLQYTLDRVSVLSPIAIDILMDTMARDRAHMYLFSV